ncbi:Cytochrome P450 [Elaphomyces granulatus]
MHSAMDILQKISAVVSMLPLWSIVAVCFFLYLVSLAVYRLYFSPLAGFPGPKLAALTQWYEFYWNVIKSGQFTFHIQDLHDRYGPIVRVNPWELHIRDPHFYESIYSQDGKRDKALSHLRWTNIPGSAFSTIDHDLHRIRRAAQNPYFSKRQILNFSPYIQSRVDKLVNRLASEYSNRKKILYLGQAYSSFSCDIVMEYCFAKGHDFLSSPDFFSPFPEAVRATQCTIHVLMHFPWILPVLKALPYFLLPTGMMAMVDFRRDMEDQIQQLIDDHNRGCKDTTHPIVFQELLDSNLPQEDKNLVRLRSEGVVLVSAGLDTVRATLEIGTFHLLQQPRIMQKLRKELLTVYPDPGDPPSLPVLEKLPYLTAVIYESLRLSYGTASRLPRVPHHALAYGPYIIPARTPLSMTSYCVHHDETLFPNSHRFIPERWLDNPKVPAPHTLGQSTIGIGPRTSTDSPLTRFLVSFTKGSRSCLGMNLAWAELYIALAAIVRRCELSLFETELADVGFVRDMLVPHPRSGSKRLRVLVENVAS